MARTHPVIYVLYKIRNLVAYTMDNLHHFCRRTVISGVLHFNEKTLRICREMEQNQQLMPLHVSFTISKSLSAVVTRKITSSN